MKIQWKICMHFVYYEWRSLFHASIDKECWNCWAASQLYVHHFQCSDLFTEIRSFFGLLNRNSISICKHPLQYSIRMRNVSISLGIAWFPNCLNSSIPRALCDTQPKYNANCATTNIRCKSHSVFGIAFKAYHLQQFYLNGRLWCALPARKQFIVSNHYQNTH